MNDSTNAMKQVQNLVFKRKLLQERKDFSLSRIYYWWKLRRSVEKSLKKVRLSPGLVLDIGAGEGSVSRIAHKILGAKWQYLLSDLGIEDLQIAQTIARDQDLQFDYLLADGCKLPLKNEKVSVILCSEVLEHLPDSAVFLKECFRVLKQGGIAIFTTPNQTNLLTGTLPANSIDLESLDIEKDSRAGFGHISVYGKKIWHGFFISAGFQILNNRSIAFIENVRDRTNKRSGARAFFDSHIRR